MELADLHIHSSLSDGVYAPENLVERLTDCIDAGEITRFGISDHYSDKHKWAVYSFLGLRNYFFELRKLRDEELRYKKIKEGEFLIGTEIDCDDGVPSIPRDTMQLADYALLERAEQRIDEVVKFRRAAGIPVGLAHPDYESLHDETILKKLVKEGIFLELNGSRETHLHYPIFFSWLPAKFRKELRFSFGSDMHNSLSAVARIRAVADFARAHRLNIIKI